MDGEVLIDVSFQIHESSERKTQNWRAGVRIIGLQSSEVSHFEKLYLRSRSMGWNEGHATSCALQKIGRAGDIPVLDPSPEITVFGVSFETIQVGNLRDVMAGVSKIWIPCEEVVRQRGTGDSGVGETPVRGQTRCVHIRYQRPMVWAMTS